MKKIRLDLDSLEVLSFATEEESDRARGTVHARVETQMTDCSAFTLGWNDSCYGMCHTHEYYTCAETQPSVGPSCDYYCTAPSVGCDPGAETELCG
jgi:hypothetical protein